MLKEVMDVIDVLDNQKAGAAEFNALLPKDICEISISPFSVPLGETEFGSYRFKGSEGRLSGGNARTTGIIGSLGALRLPGNYPGLNSDADGGIVALACALRLGRMWIRNQVLKGDVIVTTHVCQAG